MTAIRIGRKPVLWSSYLSLIISGTWSATVLMNPHIMPIELVLLSPLFLVFGGGIDVNIAVIHTIIADVASDRTNAFILTGLGAVIGSAAGPALSAVLIEKFGLWTPLYVSSGILTPVLIIVFTILPETLPKKDKDAEEDLMALPSAVPTPYRAEESFLTSLRVTARTTAKKVRKGFRESMDILNNKSIRVLLLPFVLHSAMTASGTGILAQTLGVRFGWTVAQAAYLFSAKGVLTLLVLVALPFASKALSPPAQETSVSVSADSDGPPAIRKRRRYLLPSSPFGRDLVLLQFSVFAVLVGSVLLGTPALASMIIGIVISTVAVGLPSFAKSLVAYYVDKEKTARLYVLTGMVETVGTLIAGPSLALSFGAGVKAGGFWIGMPYFYVAVFCGVVMLALVLVRPPKRRGIALGDEANEPA